MINALRLLVTKARAAAWNAAINAKGDNEPSHDASESFVERKRIVRSCPECMYRGYHWMWLYQIGSHRRDVRVDAR